jgi:hypothetical protein
MIAWPCSLTYGFYFIFYEGYSFTVCFRTALILGILYLAFQAFPVIFEKGHNFNMQSTGLSFLGIGVGMLLALATQPYWNR